MGSSRCWCAVESAKSKKEKAIVVIVVVVIMAIMKTEKLLGPVVIKK